ncbi:hypothetical protein JCM8202_004248 [Rhodotorula sphaerocarpa]
MGRSAKMMKRPTKSVSRQVNKPEQPVHRVERSLSPDAGPSAIPLFNTSVPGRQSTTKPTPQTRQKPAPKSSEGPDALDDLMDADDGNSEEEDPSTEPGLDGAAAKKKKGGLRDKVRAAKNAMKGDEARSSAKLGGGGQGAGAGRPNRKKGPKSNVLGSVDYVKLHESRPGKKKFR